MKSWKTFISGLVLVGSLAGVLLSMIPDLGGQLPWLVKIQPYLVLLVALSGAVNAWYQKDKDVTGGTRRQVAVWKDRDSLTDSERGSGYGGGK